MRTNEGRNIVQVLARLKIEFESQPGAFPKLSADVSRGSRLGNRPLANLLRGNGLSRTIRGMFALSAQSFCGFFRTGARGKLGSFEHWGRGGRQVSENEKPAKLLFNFAKPAKSTARGVRELKCQNGHLVQLFPVFAHFLWIFPLKILSEAFKVE